jgi:hypothetical protein
MNRLDQHRSSDRSKMMTHNGILGATKDNYLNQERYSCGENPYVMASLNPEFVRVPKAEDDELPEDPAFNTVLTGGEFNMQSNSFL